MWPNPQKTAYLVAFIEKILNGKENFSFYVVLIDLNSCLARLNSIKILMETKF